MLYAASSTSRAGTSDAHVNLVLKEIRHAPVSSHASVGTLLAALRLVPRAQAAAGPSGHREGKIQIPERETALRGRFRAGSGRAWMGSLSIKGRRRGRAAYRISVKDAPCASRAACRERCRSRDCPRTRPAWPARCRRRRRVPFALTRSGEANISCRRRAAPSKASRDVGRRDRERRHIRRFMLKLSPRRMGPRRAVLMSVDKGNAGDPGDQVTSLATSSSWKCAWPPACIAERSGRSV